MGDFTHGTDGSARLLEQDVPGPGRGAGADEDTFLAFHQRLGESRSVAHHTVNLTVEHQFHLPGDVAPVAGGAHDDGVGLLYHLQYALRIVLREHAFLFRTTCHAASAGLHGKVVGIHRFHCVATFLCFLFNDAEHLRNQSILPWTSVDYQYIHFHLVCFDDAKLQIVAGFSKCVG